MLYCEFVAIPKIFTWKTSGILCKISLFYLHGVRNKLYIFLRNIICNSTCVLISSLGHVTNDMMRSGKKLKLSLHLQRGALSGDGYKGAEKQRSSPHTAYEMFEGLTIKRAAEVGVTIAGLPTITDGP